MQGDCASLTETSDDDVGGGNAVSYRFVEDGFNPFERMLQAWHILLDPKAHPPNVCPRIRRIAVFDKEGDTSGLIDDDVIYHQREK